MFDRRPLSEGPVFAEVLQAKFNEQPQAGRNDRSGGFLITAHPADALVWANSARIDARCLPRYGGVHLPIDASSMPATGDAPDVTGRAASQLTEAGMPTPRKTDSPCELTLWSGQRNKSHYSLGRSLPQHRFVNLSIRHPRDRVLFAAAIVCLPRYCSTRIVPPGQRHCRWSS
jgi:hypothetical protein